MVNRSYPTNDYCRLLLYDIFETCIFVLLNIQSNKRPIVPRKPDPLLLKAVYPCKLGNIQSHEKPSKEGFFCVVGFDELSLTTLSMVRVSRTILLIKSFNH